MTLKNITHKTTITKDLKVPLSFRDSALGLIDPKHPRSLLIKTRFGIHTFLLKDKIDVIVCNDNFQVQSLKCLGPNRIYIYNPKNSIVIELPVNSIKRSKTQIGDKLKMLE